MRHHDPATARPGRKLRLAGFLALSVLAVAGLPEGYAQMYYTGCFTPKRHPRSGFDTDPYAPTTPAPALPRTLSSYYPDNDDVYPSFYSSGEPKRPRIPLPGGLPYSVLPADLPWNQGDFEDYSEPLTIPRDPTPRQPRKYQLTATPLVPPAATERPQSVILIAHLPEHAVFWVEGTRTRSLGRDRSYQSPPLPAGTKYNYRISAAWIEDGNWVSQTRLVPVQAGSIKAIYLRPEPVPPTKAAMMSLPK